MAEDNERRRPDVHMHVSYNGSGAMENLVSIPGWLSISSLICDHSRFMRGCSQFLNAFRIMTEFASRLRLILFGHQEIKHGLRYHNCLYGQEVDVDLRRHFSLPYSFHTVMLLHTMNRFS